MPRTGSRIAVLAVACAFFAVPALAQANSVTITRPGGAYYASRGLQRSLTATVTDGVGSPLSGQAVAYKVTPQGGSESDFSASNTDVSGQTTLTYTPATNVYYDVVACVDDNPANGQCDAGEVTSSTLSEYAYDPYFSFSPSTGGWAIGSNPTLTVTLYDANDNAVANHGGIDYQVSGVNTQGPSPATTNGSGQFTVAWSQSNAGDDTLYAWLDVNGNGIGPPGNDFGDPYSTHDLNFNNGSMSAYGGSFNAGDPYSATATLYNPDGSAAGSGLTVHYAITSGTGGHSGSGTVSTDANGDVSIPWPSTTLTYPSSDHLSLYYDYPGSPAGQDSNDPQTTTDYTFRNPYVSAYFNGDSSRVVGGTQIVTGYAYHGDGSSDAGQPIHWYSTSGQQGDVTADGSAHIQFTYTSSTPGSDTIYACADLNSNHACDTNEDTGSGANMTWYSGIFSSGPLTGIRWDTDMSCQTEYGGDPSGEFYGGDVPASCYLLVFTGGSLHNYYTGGSQTGISGSGTTDDPYRQTTTATVYGTSLTMSETTSYVAGQDLYRTDVTLNDSSGSPVDAYLYQYADCFLQGSDSGYGYFDQATGGAYCSKAANNNPSDRIEGFIPVADYYDSSYTWYEAGWGSQNNNGDIYPSVYSAMGGSGLPNRCLCNPASSYAYDNAMAIGWQVTVPGGGSLTRSYFTSFSPVGAVTDTSPPQVTVDSPASGSTTSDDTPTIAGTASSRSTDGLTIPVSVYSGSSASGTPIQSLSPVRSGNQWSVDALHLDPGTYTVQARQAYAFGSDRSSNTQTFTVVPPPPPPPTSQISRARELPPPTFGKSVNLEPLSGTVFVTVPGGKRVPLTSPDQVVLGSVIDATKGKVRLTITDANGHPQSADFYQGVFKISQLPKKKGGILKLTLVANTFKACPAARAARKSAARAAGKKLKKTASVRHLWGSGTGPFRTQGRFSAATVRGTTWLTDDRCDGTLTRVTAGLVTVHDDVRNKAIVLKKGQHYLAAAG